MRLSVNLQVAANSYQRWSRKWRIGINPGKCEIIVFVKKQRKKEYVVPRIFVQIDNKLIDNKPVSKLLGLSLDNQLNWNAHVEAIEKSCNQRIGLMRTLRWNNIIDATKTVKLYVSMVRSKLEYGQPAWINIKKVHQDKLQVIQNDCLRIASQVTRRMHIRINDLKEEHKSAYRA